MTSSPDPGGYRQVRFERPPASTEILLVRHGESAPAHPERRFPLVDGRGDPPLSLLGQKQAEAVGLRLAGLHLDAIVVTPLRRTAETAAPLARSLSLAPRVEPGLVEIAMGEWEGGLYRQRIAEGHPLALQVFARQRFDVVPGAESNESLRERTTAAIARVAEQHPGGRVAAFSHAVAISSVLATATGAGDFAFAGVDNASISVLVVEGDHWSLRRFNDTSHLENLGGIPRT